MKQYVHPMNGMASHGFKTDFAEGYKISNGEGLLVFGDEWISEMVLLEFGFIEKEEETDTDAKWIEDAYATYDSDPRACGPLDYEAFKQAILSHLPKK